MSDTTAEAVGVTPFRAQHAPVTARPLDPPAEMLSPFVPWSADDRAPPAANLTTLPPRESVAMDLLRGPERLAHQLDDHLRRRALTLSAIGIIMAGSLVFAACSRENARLAITIQVAGLVVASMLAAVAATLGPVYGASLILAARIPFSRLVPTLLLASAAGMLVLGGASPLLRILWRHDGVWTGQLATLTTFALAASLAGTRIRRLLYTQAERLAGGILSPGDAYRIGILTRVSLVLLATNHVLVVRALYLFG